MSVSTGVPLKYWVQLGKTRWPYGTFRTAFLGWQGRNGRRLQADVSAYSIKMARSGFIGPMLDGVFLACCGELCRPLGDPCTRWSCPHQSSTRWRRSPRPTLDVGASGRAVTGAGWTGVTVSRHLWAFRRAIGARFAARKLGMQALGSGGLGRAKAALACRHPTQAQAQYRIIDCADGVRCDDESDVDKATAGIKLRGIDRCGMSFFAFLPLRGSALPVRPRPRRRARPWASVVGLGMCSRVAGLNDRNDSRNCASLPVAVLRLARRRKWLHTCVTVEACKHAVCVYTGPKSQFCNFVRN